MFARSLGWIVLMGLSLQSVQAREYHYSDAHLHYVDFFQESEGMDALIKAMDAARIDQ